MSDHRHNLFHISEPGQVKRFRASHSHTLGLFGDPRSENMILDEIYMRILKDLVDNGMFSVTSTEDINGCVNIGVSLDVRTPPDYGKPKWESIKNNRL